MRYLKVLIVIVFVLGIGSALYMQFNLVEGEPYEYALHEITKEIAQEMQRVDAFFVPIWAMVLASTVGVMIYAFSLIGSKHSYYGGVTFMIMIGICLAACILTFGAYDHIATAQMISNKTASFVYGFWFLMIPFLRSWGLIAFVEVIKFFNTTTANGNPEDIERFKILQEILRNRKMQRIENGEQV